MYVRARREIRLSISHKGEHYVRSGQLRYSFAAPVPPPPHDGAGVAHARNPVPCFLQHLLRFASLRRSGHPLRRPLPHGRTDGKAVPDRRFVRRLRHSSHADAHRFHGEKNALGSHHARLGGILPAGVHRRFHTGSGGRADAGLPVPSESFRGRSHRKKGD